MTFKSRFLKKSRMAGTALLAGICLTTSSDAGYAAPAAGSFTGSHSGLNSSSYRVLIDQSSVSDQDELVKGAKSFIQSVADRGLSFLANDELSFDERKKEFRSLLLDSFDIRTIGRFSIGRYWRKATREQRAEYLDLFREMIIQVYSSRFDEYSGQDLKVTNARPEGKKDAIVTTKIVSENAADVIVRWRVRFSDNKYQIVDVIIEGVSMLVTQRSDFAAVIQRGGGQVDVLLEHLGEKVDEYEAKNEQERREQEMIQKKKATQNTKDLEAAE